MTRHRTTARGILVLLATLAVAAGDGGIARSSVATQARIIFPVVGNVHYIDDFGSPRPGGPHQGIDILAAKRLPAVAAEPGTVKFWTTSARAGCMLYLTGKSGTVYEYIHLNNDLTARNDNRGKCIAGVAYARGLKSGARVQAGQLVGYVGNSGDADGLASHLHFEVHPKGGKATDPYPYLQQAQHLLFTARPGTPFTLTLTGTVVAATADELTIKVSQVQAWPMALHQTKLAQPVTLTVPASALVQSVSRRGTTPVVASLVLARKGQTVVVWTQPAPTTLRAERGDPGVLAAALIQFWGA